MLQEFGTCVPLEACPKATRLHLAPGWFVQRTSILVSSGYYEGGVETVAQRELGSTALKQEMPETTNRRRELVGKASVMVSPRMSCFQLLRSRTYIRDSSLTLSNEVLHQ